MLKHRTKVRLSATRYEHEHGAVAVMTAIILSAILIGISALVVDTGVLFTERRQAQNAADAAALSVAQSCAQSTTACTDITGNPQQWATNNAKDSMAGMTIPTGGVCGTDGLPTCSNPTGDTSKLPDCPTMASTPAHYAEVHTEATNKVRGFIIGSGDDPAACSRVEWGPAGSVLATIPFTLGMCQWQLDTNHGATFPGPEIGMQLNDKGQVCPTWNGHDYPGGFGWLTTSGTCTVQIKVNDWVSGETGKGKINQNGCISAVHNSLGHIVYVPIFDCFSSTDTLCDYSGQGAGTDFHIAGLAAFYLTGVSVPGDKNDYLPGHPSASAQAMCQAQGGSCIYGYFTKGLVPVGSVDTSGNSPDLGLSAIQMIG